MNRSPCIDAPRHESFWCNHRPKALRWRTADGCSGEECRACYGAAERAKWPDLESVCVLDEETGVPVDPTFHTKADEIAIVIAALRGRP